MSAHAEVLRAAADLVSAFARNDRAAYFGADHIVDLVPPHVRCFEYRHAPDQGALENIFVPHLAGLRQQRIAKGSGGGAEGEMARRPTHLTVAS